MLISCDVHRCGRGWQDPPGPKSPRQLTDEFPDGVWVFELAAMADPAVVPDAVAAVLGITQQPGKSVARAWPPRWRAGCGCWCSTTASTCSTPTPI